MAHLPAKVADGERRYPGVASFEDSDLHRMLFYGRTEEIYDLQHLVLAERLVILFSRSGIGKTSIINAGLMQPLRDAGQFPIVVRVNSDSDDPMDSFYRGIEAACRRGVELGQIDSFEPENPDDWNKTSLWHFFKTLYLWQDDAPLSPVLIIDQFEELFTLISEQPRQEFIDQLADLVRGTRPKRMQAGDTDLGERPPDVKVVLSIREDFMANLEEMAERIPAILNVRFRLAALDTQQARQAIVEPSQLEDSGIATPAFEWADDALQCTVDFLRSRKSAKGGSELGDTVEPFQLQLICQYVEDRVLAEQLDKVTLEALGGEATLREILAKFYSDSIDRICREFPQRGLGRRIERLCEYGLITPKGRRLLREESTIIESNGVPGDVLARMVQLRLIRKEPRIGDNYYELSHDTLIVPILQSRERRESRKRRRRYAASATFVAIVAVAFAVLLDSYWATKKSFNALDLLGAAQASINGSGQQLAGGALAAVESLSIEDSEDARDVLRSILSLLPLAHESLPVLDRDPQSENAFQAAAFGGSGPLLIAYSADNTVKYRSVADPGISDSWVGDVDVTALALSPDGEYVAAAVARKDYFEVRLRNVNDQTSEVLFVPESSVLAMTFADLGNQEYSLVVADADGLELRDLASGRLVGDQDISFAANAISVSDRASHIAAANHATGDVRVWTDDLGRQHSLECKPRSVSALGIGSNGRLLAIASRNGVESEPSAGASSSPTLNCSYARAEDNQRQGEPGVGDTEAVYGGSGPGNQYIGEPEPVYADSEGSVYEATDDEVVFGDSGSDAQETVDSEVVYGEFETAPAETDGLLGSNAEMVLGGGESVGEDTGAGGTDSEKIELRYVGDSLRGCANANNTIQVFDVNSDPVDEIGRVSVSGCVLAVSVDDRNRVIAVMSNGAVHEWTIHVPGVLAGRDSGTRISEIRVNSQGNRVAVRNEEGTLRYWDVARFDDIALLDTVNDVEYMDFSADGSAIWLVDRESQALAVSLEDNRELWTRPLQGFERILSSSPEGESILTISGDTGRVRFVLPSSERPPLNLDDAIATINTDSSSVAALYRDGTLRLWGPDESGMIREWNGPEGGNKVIFSNDGSRLVSASDTGQVTLFDARNGQELNQWSDGAEYPTPVFSEDSSVVAVAGSDGILRVFDSQDGSLRSELPIGDRASYVAMSDDGSVLVSSTYGFIRLWSTADQLEISSWEIDDETREVLVSPSKRYVATTSWDGVLQVRDTEQDVEALRMSDVGSIAGMTFGDDETALQLILSDGTLREIPIPYNLRNEACSRLRSVYDADVRGAVANSSRYRRVCPRQ